MSGILHTTSGKSTESSGETLKAGDPPICLILCTEKGEAVAHDALGGMNNKVFASRYKLQLPDPNILAREIEAERRRLEQQLNSKTSGN